MSKANEEAVDLKRFNKIMLIALMVICFRYLKVTENQDQG